MTIRVLAIDDDPCDLEIVARGLRPFAQIELTTCADFDDGITHVRSSPFDLILLDLCQPPFKNFEALSRLQAEVSDEIPIIVLTGADDVAIFTHVINAGAQDCICKNGLEGSHLFRSIHNALEREKLLHQLRLTASSDALTGLPNRKALVEEIEARLGSQTKSSRFSLIFIDVDDFKLVNDSHGHDVGDQFLVEFVKRIQACLGPNDRIARFGGDEFVVLLSDVLEHEQVRDSMTRIEQQLHRPFLINSLELYANFSAGVATAEAGHLNALQLLREADTAMYAAKSRGKSRYAHYDARMRTDALERLDLERALWHALENDEVSIHYQPLVNIESQQPVGFEALARWEHLELPVSPLKFIPIAERTGLIHNIGLWVLETACTQLNAWSAVSPKLQLSVNVSPVQLERTTFASNVVAILKKLNLDPGRLTIEVTESGAIKDFEHVAAMLESLLAAGIRVSIDDFGTGHSSLSLLHRLPVSEVKVDRSFIKCVEDEADYSRLFVQTIQMLAQGIGLGLVAEGIENAGQASVLRDCGYTIGQGYLFSRPLPACDATAYLESKTDSFKQAAL